MSESSPEDPRKRRRDELVEVEVVDDDTSTVSDGAVSAPDPQFAREVFYDKKKNILQRYFIRVKTVLTEPKRFFMNMPDQGFMGPLGFLCTSAFIFSFLFAATKLNPLILPIAFITSVTTAGIGAVICHLIFKHVFKGEGNFVRTFGVVAYSKATLLFAWISLGPLAIGGYLSIVYRIYLNVVGFKRVHNIDTKVVAFVTIVLALLELLWKR